MHLLYADETNLDPRGHEFFVYGGIVIPCETAKELHNDFEALRIKFKITPETILKFNPRPNHLTHEEFIAVKSAVFEIAVKAKCTFLITLSYHKILKSVEEARRGEINRIAFHFNSLLNRRNDSGLMLIDRFSDKQLDQHLREKFSVGLTGMPYSDTLRLKRLLGIHYSAIGQSHFTSLIDILIGSVRFAVDSFASDKEGARTTARTILEKMGPLFERETDKRVSDLSIHFTPQIIKVKSYRERYQALKDFFTACGSEPAQGISEYRMY